MNERCHPVLEAIIIDSLLDGVDRYGEKFATLLQQDLTFEQKGKIIDLLAFELSEHADIYIEDPENLYIDEVSFDSSLAKVILSEVLNEALVSRPKPSQLGMRQKFLRGYGKSLIKSGIKTSRAADTQIAANRNRLFGGGAGTVRDRLTYARKMAGTRTLGGAALAGMSTVGAGLKAARGIGGLAVGGARKMLAKGVMARGRRLRKLPYLSYQARQRREDVRKEMAARRQQYANVPAGA